jgi:hypothetical protein
MSDAADRLRNVLQQPPVPVEDADSEVGEAEVPRIQVGPQRREVFLQIETSGSPAALIALEILDHDDNPVVQVLANGDIIYGDGYDPDKAARTFWAAMATHFSRNFRLNRKK